MHSIDQLIELLHGRRAVILAGAGCSTESGIPDYRGPDSPKPRRPPIQYQEFMRSAESRQRYWARSAVGWTRISRAKPNATHFALAQMEQAGACAGVITQNVDGLHHLAGSKRVVELHGALAKVCCTDCGNIIDRHAYQNDLVAANPEWNGFVNGHILSAPDGDAELPTSYITSFVVPACAACDGVMKPDVVFFGENVPRARVDEAWSLFDECDVLLVVGSSLTVYSGRRFTIAAAEQGKPIALVNLGPTRADDVAALKVEVRLGEALPLVAARLAR